MISNAVFTLLGLIFLSKRTQSANCDASGASSTYTETIENQADANQGKIRHIVASGCPNHVNYLVGGNPNNAEVNEKDIEIPAYPCISSSGSFDVLCVPSAVGLTLNGISIYSKYAGGTCNDDNDAVVAEGDTFDSCSGHSAPGGDYHYHTAPACLLDQLNDTTATGHSPLIGWAMDGFPIFGPHGVDGEMLYGCSHSSANAADCVDTCNGHDQHETEQGFLYHYHLLGPIGDLVSSPLDPLPGESMSPYTIGCLKGVPYDWDTVNCGGNNTPDCDTSAVCASNGTAASYVPVAEAGVTAVYVSDPDTSAVDAQVILDGVFFVVSLYAVVFM